MGWDAPWHWVILAIVVIALFGYKKMPDAARSLGRSLRIFKTEIKGMSEDDRVRSENKAVTGAPPAVESVSAPAPPAPVPTEPAAGSEAPAPTEPSASAVPPADAELPATAKNDTPSA